MIKVGPQFWPWGTSWDHKGRTQISQIFISCSPSRINSIYFAFVEGGKIVLSDKIGGAGEGTTSMETITLDYPSEYITGVSGGFEGSYGGPYLSSITFYTNKANYGPYAPLFPDKSRQLNKFNYQAGGKFYGFFGSYRSDGIESIGFYMKPLEKLGKFVELSIGANSCAKKAGSSIIKPGPTATHLANQTISPPSNNETDKQPRKRSGVLNQDKANAAKKVKAAEEPPSNAVVELFSEVAKDNFSTDDVKQWCSRSGVEADIAFRQSMGQAFFHGLSQFAAKDSKIKDLEGIVRKLKDAEASHHQEVCSIQKKAADEANIHKRELERLQEELRNMKLKLSKKDKEHSTEIALLQSTFKLSESNHMKELHDAFNDGFLGYLKGFLGAHSDYDWSLYFPPSTSQFMAKFKADNAEAIEEERLNNKSKKAAELEAFQRKD